MNWFALKARVENFGRRDVAAILPSLTTTLDEAYWGTKTEDRVELFQVDDGGFLFISPTITDWAILDRYKVDTVIDLDGALDDGVPTAPNHLLYVYFPIFDQDLPNLAKLHAVAALGATLVRQDHCVLSHCGLGFNRSALVAGLILNQLGMSGYQAIERLRGRRPGALFNDCFASYLQSL